MGLSTNPQQILAQIRAMSPEQIARLDASERALIESFVSDELARQMDERCAADTLYWLQNHTATENPQHAQQGLPYIAAFPKRSYFAPLFRAFATYEALFIPKSRTMMTSWAAMGWGTHQAQWHKWEVIVQTENENKAAELLDYSRQLYEHQDDCLKALHPLKAKNLFEIAWAGGGRVLTIPKGETKIRLFHPTLYIMDEAAFMPEGEECFNAVKPTGCRIICISSAAPGWFQYQCEQ